MADWPTKRAWVDYAFDELPAAGYAVSSAYTLVKDKRKVNFSYRDNLWRGSDLLATGVASFGHVSGVHYQNQPDWPRLRRRAGSRRAAAGPRHAADAASVAGARDDLAAQDRRSSTPIISAASSASTSSSIGTMSGEDIRPKAIWKLTPMRFA